MKYVNFPMSISYKVIGNGSKNNDEEVDRYYCLREGDVVD